MSIVWAMNYYPDTNPVHAFVSYLPSHRAESGDMQSGEFVQQWAVRARLPYAVTCRLALARNALTDAGSKWNICPRASFPSLTW